MQFERAADGGDQTTRERVARSILVDGPSTALALSERLDLTPAAVRRHLDLMVEDGAVEATGRAAPPTVGFVVSKAVGNAVARSRVRRRLRHLCAERLGTLPVGSVLVVRALPAAAAASYSSLGADLEKALSRVSR